MSADRPKDIEIVEAFSYIIQRLEMNPLAQAAIATLRAAIYPQLVEDEALREALDCVKQDAGIDVERTLRDHIDAVTRGAEVLAEDLVIAIEENEKLPALRNGWAKSLIVANYAMKLLARLESQGVGIPDMGYPGTVLLHEINQGEYEGARR